MALDSKLACKGPLNARLATGVGLSFFLSFLQLSHTVSEGGAAFSFWAFMAAATPGDSAALTALCNDAAMSLGR